MEKKKRGSKARWIVLAVIAFLLLVFALVGFITDFLWFKELGYVSVFFTKLLTQIKIGVPVFVVVGFLVYIYLKLLKKGYYKKVESLDAPNEKAMNIISWVLAGIFSCVATYFCVSNLWYKWLNFAKSTDFDISDPLYNNDISLYVFKLPFIKEVNGIIIALSVAFIIITLIYYAMLLSMRKPTVFEDAGEDSFDDESSQQGSGFAGFDNAGGLGDMFGKFAESFGGRGPVHRPARKKKQFDSDNFNQLLHIASKQLIVVGVIFFVMLAVDFFLKQYDLLYNHTGAVYGAGYTDVTVTLWMYRALAGLSLLGAAGFIIGISKKKVKTIAIVPIIMILVGLVGAGGAVLVQNYVVSPDELNKESKYLERNIEYTQYAYGVDNVTTKSFAASKNLDSTDINNNPETITNIRINDYSPANKFYNQTQAIRTYYNFNDVFVDRYYVNGEYTQTFLAAREVDIDGSKISDTWLNRHIKYTHGYGVTLSRVDKVTSSGQPDVLVGDIPPQSSVDEIQIDNPAIYFGQLTNDYILVGTDEEEFDYPGDEANQYTKYSGTAGIKMNFANRCLFSIRERSLKLLVSSNITGDSKIVINRNITSRVKKIMPYLTYDKNPYMVTANGGLYWIYDAYTTTSSYPYSEPYSQQSSTNYIRNSVKVVIDAYNGDTSYYVVDDSDPIAKTLQKIYPKLFRNFDEMDEAVKAHVRYPNTMFDIQATIYERYHMNDVNAFYQNEDIWSIANEIYGKDEKEMTPNYYILKLPGEKDAEFVNSIPYTPKGKRNMTSLLIARNDGDNYGQIVLYKFPKSKAVYGPMQIEALIDQNPEISKEFALWSSAGTSYSRGNLFVIPIEDSLLYVEPVYLEANKESIPEVKRVIVAFNDQIAYKPTLAEALESLFGETDISSGSDNSSSQTAEDGQMSQAELIKAAAEAYDSAQSAMKNGDWEGYGKYLDQLEKYLNELQK